MENQSEDIGRPLLHEVVVTENDMNALIRIRNYFRVVKPFINKE